MGLITSRELLKAARQQGFAICGFNIHNMETLKAVTNAAAEAMAPVILQATPGTIRFAGPEFLVALARAAQEKYGMPLVLHLDHGDDYAMVEACLEAGFTSVMIDGSKLPYAENIALVRLVVEKAHNRGVTVEAELGTIGGVEDDLSLKGDGVYTDPDTAADFVARTGIDSLAVAIGTCHGLYKQEPKLDFERLRKIREKVGIPLVLHGASDLPDSSVKRCIELGISKVNIATELKVAYAAEIKKVLDLNPEESDPRKLFMPGIQAVQEVVKHKLELTGSSGKG